MSFLIDPPWLYANGRVIAQAVPPERQRPLALATIGVFLATSISRYLDKGWTLLATYPFWLWLGLRHGQD